MPRILLIVLLISLFIHYEASAKKAVLCGKIIPDCHITDSTIKPVSVMLRKAWPIAYYQLEQCMVDTTDFSFRFEVDIDELTQYEVYINCFENIDTTDFIETGLPLAPDVMKVDSKWNSLVIYWDTRYAFYIEPFDSISLTVDNCKRDEFDWPSLQYNGKGSAKNNHHNAIYQEYPIHHGFMMPIREALYWENEHLKYGINTMQECRDSVSDAYFKMMNTNVAFMHINAMHTYIRAALYSDNPQVAQNKELTRELYQFMDSIELKPEFLASEQFRIFLEYYQEYISRVITGMDVMTGGDAGYIMAQSLYKDDVLKYFMFDKLMMDMQSFHKFFSMDSQYNNFLTLFPDSEEAKVLTRVFERHSKVKVGHMAPELILKNKLHQSLKLSDLEGEVCLITSARIWEKDWQKSAKKLRKMYGRNLKIISLTDNYEQRNPWFWQVYDYYVDNSLPQIKPYYMPHNSSYNYIIGKKGVIRVHRNTFKKIDNHIYPLLKEKYNIITRLIDFSKKHTAILLGTISTLIILILVVFIWAYYRQQKQQRQKQQLGMELKAIRSQLNPHFLFNALNSIQNFINKANTKEANFHLTRFARLMRQVLEFSEKESISLKEELDFLKDYLELESLRYGFQLEIIVDPTIDVYNMEIPALITQPFIENAIVHAMADMGEKGILRIDVLKKQKTLIINVIDNGKGFNDNHKNGFGLRGSLDRIKIINARHEQNIELDIACNEDDTGCKVSLSIPMDV